MVPLGVPPIAGWWPVMATLKKQRPLIRYAGSAAETSIGSKPIGSELSAGVYPKRYFCQASLALVQIRAYLPTLRQTCVPNRPKRAIKHCLYRRFTLTDTLPIRQNGDPEHRPGVTPHTLWAGSRIGLTNDTLPQAQPYAVDTEEGKRGSQ